MDMIQEKGVSVVLCCFNSAGRICNTLQSLARQQLPSNYSCEVILVNNNSSDDTASLATSEWEKLNTSILLHIVDEHVPGLMYARRTGLAAALHDVIVFCDDDNWLSDQYLQTALAILSDDNSIAACGGHGIPVFESSKPMWFDKYAEAFATGPQTVKDKSGRLVSLYGAGLTVRKKAIQVLEWAGFHPVLTGRLGASLSSGEDTEMTNALVLAGYRLVYSPDLVFHHYMPDTRMTTGYLKKLFLSFGNEGPVRNLYQAYLQPGRPYGWMKNWAVHIAAALIRMLKYMIVPPKESARSLYFLWSLTYLKSLWKIRPAYSHMKKNIEIIQDRALLPHLVEINVMSVLFSGYDRSIQGCR